MPKIVLTIEYDGDANVSVDQETPCLNEGHRQSFLVNLSEIVEICLCEARKHSAAEKMDLLVFSILSMIDGESIFLPRFKLTPNVQNGDGWPWPAEDLSDGELHSRWANMEKSWLVE